VLCLAASTAVAQFTFKPDLPILSPTVNEFAGVSYDSIAFADVDGDNDPGVLITGYGGTDYIARLCTNDGKGGFFLTLP